MSNTSNAGFYSYYYPINFSPADRFVFYDSLRNKESPLVKNLVRRIEKNLYGRARNPTMRDKDRSPSKQMEKVLFFLEQAYLFERQKEQKFFQEQLKKHPELEEILNKYSNSGDYITFIAQLNSMLHGAELFKKELDTEIKRIKRYNEANYHYKTTRKRKRELQKLEHTNTHYKGNLTPQQTKDRKELSEIFRIHENLLTDDGTTFSADNPYFTLDGKQVFQSIFSSQSYISTITTAVIEKYGAKLFSYQSGQLKINTQQLNVLIKLLTDKAYELLLLNEGGFKRGKKGTDARGIIRNENLLRAKRVVDSKDFEAFVENLLNAPEEGDLFEALNTIAEQYKLPFNSFENIKATKAEITSLRNKVKKAYERERSIARAQGKKFQTFSSWRKSNNITDDDLKQMILQSKSIHVQAYYTNEGMNVVDLLSNGIQGAVVSGHKNLTDDVIAGYLVIESSFNDSSFQKIIQKTKRNLTNVQKYAMKEMRKTVGVDDLRKNTYELNKARQEQKTILEEANKEIKEIYDGVQDILSHINIHTSIKGYKSISAGRYAFEGAAFGSDIIEQATILEDLFEAGGISTFDRDWLIFALINCGEGMIGKGNKHHLEDYLSMVAGLLMFNDAYLISQDVRKFIENTYVNASVEDIHLYVLNNIYIPNSYILEETYHAMFRAFIDLEGYINGGDVYHKINLTLKTYDTGYKKTFSQDELDFDKGGIAWFNESKAAIKQTTLTMTFLAGFLDILEQISQAMPNS